MRPLGGGSSRWCRKPATENSKALWEGGCVSLLTRPFSPSFPVGFGSRGDCQLTCAPGELKKP